MAANAARVAPASRVHPWRSCLPRSRARAAAEPRDRGHRSASDQRARSSVPRRRPRSRNRGGVPPHPRDRRLARPGRDRVRVRRARGARLGEGAASRMAGHARAWHPGAVNPSRPRADRLLRLDRDRFLRWSPASPAPVRRHGDRRGGRGFHCRPGGADARARGSRLGPRDLRLSLGLLAKSYETRANDPERIGR